MRGAQIFLAMRSLGVDCHYTHIRGLDSIKDSIIVLIKFYNQDQLPLLLENRNWLVYDAVDFNDTIYSSHLLHGVIVANRTAEGLIKAIIPSGARTRVIYHHYDPDMMVNRCGEERLRLIYLGAPGNSNFLNGELPDLAVVTMKNKRWRDIAVDFNCHFSCRLDPKKHVVKLANAAATDSVFLTGREPGCVELLGEDYPYYIEQVDNLAHVQGRIQYLKETIGGEVWRRAKERIRPLKEFLRPTRVCQDYLSFFRELLDSPPGV